MIVLPAMSSQQQCSTPGIDQISMAHVCTGACDVMPALLHQHAIGSAATGRLLAGLTICAWVEAAKGPAADQAPAPLPADLQQVSR